MGHPRQRKGGEGFQNFLKREGRGQGIWYNGSMNGKKHD
jgi:hypothetical protein